MSPLRTMSGTELMDETGMLAVTLQNRLMRAARAASPRVDGIVSDVVGLGIGVRGLKAAVGEQVVINTQGGPLPAQVVALHAEGVTCLPLGSTAGVSAGDVVASTGDAVRVPCGYSMLGRVVDALGRPLDGQPPATGVEWVSTDHAAPNPLHRRRVSEVLPTGVRAMDTMIPVGAGQRIGIMAGSGVGKSTLLGMCVRGTAAPVRVVALVGERGREVRDFIEDTLDATARSRTVMVVATGDDAPLLRLQAVFSATRIAEWFRDQGEDVLMVVDSITRTALAQREVALAAGEPPATRGFPASVFAMLPRLLERSGPGEHGTITALYTVLVEGDDLQDPIGDTVRGILDGHVVLDRRLATAGHFPSIDVLESISRVERAILPENLRQIAARARRLLAAWRDVKDLVEVGAYAGGSDPITDLAIQLRGPLEEFLRQAPDHAEPVEDSWRRLAAIVPEF